MATIDAKTGQILDGTGADGSGGGTATPAQLQAYVANMGNILGWVAKQSSPTVEGSPAQGLALHAQGLQQQQAGLATPGQANPLNFLFNGAGYNQAGMEGDLASVNSPAILSTQNQAAAAAQTSSNVENTVSAQEQNAISAYKATQPAWTLSPTLDPETGKQYYINTNVPPGQPPQIYEPGSIPPGVSGGTANGVSSTDTHTLAAANNTYGIKASSNTMSLFTDAGLSPTIGPAASDGGNFIAFANTSDADKAARVLLTSPTYADDSVDQALKTWSGGGYDASILKGTGIDPNSLISAQSSVQIDTILAAMKQAEAVGSSTPASTQTFNPLVTKLATQVANGIMSYDMAFNQISGALPTVGPTIAANQLLTAIQAVNPKFNVNQSNAQAAAQISNTTNAGNTAALVDRTNSTLDMMETAFRNVGLGESLGGIIGKGTTMLSDFTGLGKGNTDAYTSLLQEARASLQAVLNSAAGLGVVTGGVTAQSLLPDSMTFTQLPKQIAIARQLMENTKAALANLSNASASPTVPTAPVASAGGTTYKGFTLPN